MIFQKLVPCLNFISPAVSSQHQVDSIYFDLVSHTNLLYTFSVFCFSDFFISFISNQKALYSGFL